MQLTLKQLSISAFDQMSPREVSALLVDARALQRAAAAGHTQPLLRGKNFGLLCEADDVDAALFRSAAMEMGARVAHIRPSLSELSTPQEVRRTARMLGRLYDAVECQGMVRALVQQVSNDAGVPIYDGIASKNHPTARLAELLGNGTSPADNRRFVLQAVLLSTMG
ncbi:MAG: ornithine carbamoyltransferase [Longimicrobiales bacterium]